jgi:NADH-quinone oxidoreductase subunit J
MIVAVTGLADASAWAVYFVGAGMALVGAFGVVLLRNPVHCALSLVTTIFGIAMLFLDQGADFLAAVQVIVYAGAIVILFLFVIMLLGVDRSEPRSEGGKLRGMLPAGIVVGVVALAELLVLARVHYWATGAQSVTEATTGPGENVQKLGQSIFTAYLLPFEMTAALLVIAVVAAVVLVRRTGPEASTPPRRAVAARPQVKAPSGGLTHTGLANAERAAGAPTESTAPPTSAGAGSQTGGTGQ